MTNDSDFPIDGLLALEPSPDEEAWEAFLFFALERMGGAHEATAIDMGTLRKLELALGVQLPFEIGLFLVVGVPDEAGWVRWGDDPAREYAEWSDRLEERILTDVATVDGWPQEWGDRPDSADDRERLVRDRYAGAPPLLPLYGNRVVPLTVAEGEDAAESNPILAVDGATVTTVGSDIAAWLNAEFDVPLPMWPETPKRTFPFWRDLAD